MIYKIIRAVLGVLFVVSGWVKAIDPVGVSYKIGEYISSFGMDTLQNYSLHLAVLLCAFELFLGVMLIFNFWKKAISYLTFCFLAVFTIITFYLLVTPDSGIADCGCFGDAIVLTDTETFIKNIIFGVLAYFYARYNFKLNFHVDAMRYGSRMELPPLEHKRVMFLRGAVYFYVGLCCLFVPFYSVMYLPPYDYLAFNRGVNLAEAIALPEGADEGDVITKLIYKSKSNGEQREFEVEDQEWQDETKWEYVDTKTITLREPTRAEIESFSVIDGKEQNVADSVLGYEGYTFILSASDIHSLLSEDFNKLKNIYSLYKGGKVNLFVFTASDLNDADRFLARNGLIDVPAYNVDVTNLKSLLRNKKGVLLLQNGVIKGKWNFRSNTFSSIKYSELPVLVKWEKIIYLRYFLILGVLVLIMIYFRAMYRKNFRMKS